MTTTTAAATTEEEQLDPEYELTHGHLVCVGVFLLVASARD